MLSTEGTLWQQLPAVEETAFACYNSKLFLEPYLRVL